MADTIREKILQGLKNQMARLTDYGAVYRGRTYFTYDELPAMSIMPGMETSEREYGEQKNTLPLSVHAVQAIGDNGPGVVAETIIGNLVNNVIDGRGNITQPPVAGGGADWTESGTTAGEYYYGGTLVTHEPVSMFRAGVEMTEGELGSLGNNEWAYGDQDSLGSDHLYIKVSEGDPDGLAEDTIKAQIVYMDDIKYTGGGVESWPGADEQSISVQINLELRYSCNTGDPYTQTTI